MEENWLTEELTKEERDQMREFLEEVLTKNGVKIDETRFELVSELGEEYIPEVHLWYWDNDSDRIYVACSPTRVYYADDFDDVTEFRRSLK